MMERSHKSPTKLTIPRFQTKNSDLSSQYKTTEPREFKPKTSFVKSNVKIKDRERLNQNLERIKKNTGFDR